MKLIDHSKERIIPISNEGEEFYIYFTGTTHYDENSKGEKVEREDFYYLDEHFNRFIMNGSRSSIMEEHVISTFKGCDVIMGSHSPEIETVDGKYIPNTNKDTWGLWKKATRSDLYKYHDILNKQSRERKNIKIR